jgi:hypothetical protein
MVRATTPAQRALALAVLLAVPAAHRAATARPVAVPGREIVLDAKTARGAIKIHTARNLQTVVEFPENVVTATCPVCTDGKEPDTSALFRVEKMADAYVTITPLDGVGKRMQATDRVSTVFVQLEGGTVVILYLDTVASAREADPRVILAYPKRAAQARVDQKPLDKTAEEKITEAATDKFLSAFMAPHECSQKSVRARNDDIVLRVTEICHFGRQVLVSFNVENRARAPFEVEAVTLNRGEQKTKKGVLSARTIAFDETTRGVEYFVLAEGDSAQGPYQLMVSEKGGQHRVVSVDGITR